MNEINRLAGRGRKNKKPEKDVEADCLKWMKAQSWDVGIYEAKNTKDKFGSYLASRMPPGTCDCMGITPYGIPIYVEFKAKGNRSSFNLDRNIRQREFLIDKINYFGFGCVVDSVSLLDQVWNEFFHMIKNDCKFKAREYLLNALPQKKEKP